MEAPSPAEAKRTTTGGREAKPKAAKKVLSKEEKDVESVKLGRELKLAVDLVIVEESLMSFQRLTVRGSLPGFMTVSRMLRETDP
jgi:hypothetical protein